jgi:hypothetical protein
MQLHQQHQEESLRRVQSFLDAHADVVGSLKESEARKQLDDAVGALSTQTLAQGSAGLDSTGKANRVRQLTSDLKTQHMQPIAKFSRAKLKGVPDFAALTQSASQLRGNPLVKAALAMATAALPHADVLTQSGFAPDAVQQLGAAANTLQTAITDVQNTRVARIGATKGIRAQLVRGRDAVHMLDAVVTKPLSGNPALLAGWRSAKRVTARPVSASVPVVVPATGSAAKPAVAATPTSAVAPGAAPVVHPPVAATPEVKAVA